MNAGPIGSPILIPEQAHCLEEAAQWRVLYLVDSPECNVYLKRKILQGVAHSCKLHRREWTMGPRHLVPKENSATVQSTGKQGKYAR